MKHATLAGFSCWCSTAIALILLSLPIPLRASPPFQSTAQHQIMGTVRDSNGKPLGGVNIVVSVKGKGTVSDFDGTYAIMAFPQDTLTFSFIGFKTMEIPVNGQTTPIDVQLEENVMALNEVTVNAGYYTVKEKERTGSISRITSKDIEKQPVSNPLAAMQGRMPGVDIRQSTGVPGGGFSVQIRGQNSIRNDGNDPLYIVDGVPYISQSLGYRQVATILPGDGASPLNSLNPEDIESIEVLKDADATSIYGSRGANGVVLITTKKGKEGKTRINIKASSGIGKVTRKMNLLDTQQYLEMRREAYANDGINEYPANAYDVNGTWDQNKYTDWQEEFIGGTAYRTNIRATVSGGSDQTQFLIGGGFQKETTVFPGDFDYSKGSVNTNLHHQSKDQKFSINLTANFVSDRNNLMGTDLTSTSLLTPPNAPALYTEEGVLNWENSTWANPLRILEVKYLGKTTNLISNLILNYEVFNDLDFKVSLGYNELNLKETKITPSSFFNPAFGLGSEVSSHFANNNTLNSWIIEPQLNWLGEPFTVDDIYRQFKGGPENNDKAVLEVFEEHNKRVEKQNFSQRRLQQVKDMFVFCCYTGLAYREMADFDEEKLSRTFNQWKSQSRKSKFHILP